MNKNNIKTLIADIIKLRNIATDEQALQVPNLYPLWENNTVYEIGYRVRYNNVLYKVQQAHTSQEDLTPDTAISLFAKVLIADSNDNLD